jgi:lipopolysaccharide export system permease protein
MSNDHIHRRINDSTYFYIRVYDNNIKTAHTVSVETIVDGKLVSKILAENAVWSDLTKTWMLHSYFKRDLKTLPETLIKGDSLKMDINLDPTILVKRWTHIEELNRDEIIEKIKDLKLQGAENTIIYELELYRRTSKCFGIIILTIIGAILASKKIRGGLGLHLMAGITLSSAFELIQKFADTFAINANLEPIIAVWIPNVLYLLIATLLWKKYQE